MRKSTSLIRSISNIARGRQAFSQQSVLQEARRFKQRQLVKPPTDDDADFIDWPNERLGNQIKVNLQLNEHGVAPSNDAYHNLYSRALLQRVQNIDKSTKSVRVESSWPQNLAYFTSTKEKPWPAQKNFLRQVRLNLCDAKELFVRDAVVGANFNIRVVSDSPITDLYLSKLLARAPGSDIAAFQPQLLVFAASNFSWENRPTVLYSRDERVVAVTGSSSLELVREAITGAVADLSSAANASAPLLLNADVVSHKNGSGSTLVFASPRDSFLRLQPHNVFAAHASLWSGASGLSRAFSAVRVAADDKSTAGRGDLVEVAGKSTVAHLKSVSASAPLSPSNVVFLAADAQLPPSVELSPQQAHLFLLSGLSSQQPLFSSLPVLPDAAVSVAARFRQLLQERNVRSFVVNAKNSKRPFNADEFDAFITNPRGHLAVGAKELDAWSKQATSFVQQSFPTAQL